MYRLPRNSNPRIDKLAIGIVSVAISICLATGASAQDFQAGFDAFKAREFDTAIGQWRPLANDGDVRAKIGLARIYSDISYSKYDFAKAVRLYEQAAKAGAPDAMIDLADLYFYGRGVIRDEIEAMKWFELAKLNGSPLGYGKVDQLASSMTAEQIAEAKRRASDWSRENGH